ncbi:putative peptidase C12, ubiquitin carboxyl-terminal hydrolase 1 [Monocercomonoides exilis]|uniref:putative peptidase C12, ubiquitin carboxyl-terminal hydrolase 1 n=1 Tax=Monocercomonoides exilis TaxID=2049356 RepID=UPI00355A7917|nr:putative peptidase C12, ubiquitin carboxyl-terminal hydrolase 1 [Monocercomonoides exilis]|eukprot:MONOS_1953.1-p1 / transcript=MONOS_1953.1 / gene=MONOS_1953 / organism=Monocercomonoides_exilis_PA203 / gene_product=peptidase C12, ubiquitin carboxyl-terminal hydrolase 1 / transcript_product=peptidase C12, ubiquitin carboxyl-terminal hydrolase 1 / location=Mono_scaffold00037:139965-141026(-) / protein_length=251 / sequence_SO=supercontig / SO=protein_coding / is_pseudo=false
MRWLPLESNPDVLNAYTRALGLSIEHTFADIYGLDDDLLEMIPQPVHAIYVLFPHEKTDFDESTLSKDDSIYFVDQDPAIGNACGTIAIMNSFGNIGDKIRFKPNSFFPRFYEQTRSMSSAERGKAVMGEQELEQAHLGAAHEGQSECPPEDAHVDYHFIAFIEKKGRLIELDGIKPRPVDHGPCSPENLLKGTANVVKKMIEESNDKMGFSLIALTNTDPDDLKELIEKEKAKMEEDEKEEKKEEEKKKD